MQQCFLARAETWVNYELNQGGWSICLPFEPFEREVSFARNAPIIESCRLLIRMCLRPKTTKGNR